MVELLLMDAIIRLLLSTLIGALIGLEREIHGISAGFRAHALVCLGATIFTLASIQFTLLDPQATLPGVTTGVVSGIGFLGAGAIFSDKKGLHHGFTTAANIWVIAAIGMVIGIGQIAMAIIATTLVLIILAIGKILEIKVLKRKKRKII